MESIKSGKIDTLFARGQGENQTTAGITLGARSQYTLYAGITIGRGTVTHRSRCSILRLQHAYRERPLLDIKHPFGTKLEQQDGAASQRQQIPEQQLGKTGTGSDHADPIA